jgi:hypothetical protein
MVRVDQFVLNLSQVAYIRLGQEAVKGDVKGPIPSARVFFIGAPDRPLEITGPSAEQLKRVVAGMGLPLSDRIGSFDAAEAARRGFGNPNSHTFGGLGVPSSNGVGIFLTGSVPGTPAAALGLEYGDLIVSINGRPVNTQAEYVRAVHESPDTMGFVVRDGRTGQLRDMTASLRRPGVGTVVSAAVVPVPPAPVTQPAPVPAEVTPPAAPPVKPGPKSGAAEPLPGR